ncbi:NAD(P)H-hydrate dehydratase [Flavobacterium sp. CYK-55]|uniref:NAD(P)H-hydrate dehydratase n=1 Tax=Flavobacterium sp. CYK-55 TaxID=2835529 RepID=UPI001BCBA91B|nr:NAD(P)H-hydrate dehydratase [Flavobacterium sp. CYK-55]MBS7786780.1 NAD(P)H-hydrate dehydratase [Flavobacterium sp. CYK-55]
MNLPVSISASSIAQIYRVPSANAHKGTLGHALIIGGSYGKIGAVCLASKAALKSGCGLVTAFLPECGYSILQTYVPEVMVQTDVHQKHITHIQYPIQPSAIGIGPGIGQEPQTQKAFHHWLQQQTQPIVIDADALNILAQNPDWLSFIPAQSILTPHPKELERLIGSWKNDDEMLQKTIDLSQKHQLVVVVKGAPSRVVFGPNIHLNTTGNVALATAGSGDVLTGIITGLLAQSYAPLEAAILGVYLHGKAADIAVPEMGTQAFIASDILNYLGKAFLTLSLG